MQSHLGFNRILLVPCGEQTVRYETEAGRPVRADCALPVRGAGDSPTGLS